jgi:hypothetical protein
VRGSGHAGAPKTKLLAPLGHGQLMTTFKIQEGSCLARKNWGTAVGQLASRDSMACRSQRGIEETSDNRFSQVELGKV